MIHHYYFWPLALLQGFGDICQKWNIGNQCADSFGRLGKIGTENNGLFTPTRDYDQCVRISVSSALFFSFNYFPHSSCTFVQFDMQYRDANHIWRSFKHNFRHNKGELPSLTTKMQKSKNVSASARKQPFASFGQFICYYSMTIHHDPSWYSSRSILCMLSIRIVLYLSIVMESNIRLYLFGLSFRTWRRNGSHHVLIAFIAHTLIIIDNVA